jgi:ATP-dependent phosphofructokinase / diphosphate-dependent phosphofructokinase
VRFGVLTGGGDCPGLNPAIRAVVRRASAAGHDVVGFRDGWKGLRDDEAHPLTAREVHGLERHGGTVLGTSRTNPFASEADATKVLATFDRHRLDVLVAIGGDDTLTAARELARRGRKVVGVPKTMDNDVRGTDWTFGFHSSVAVAVDALERLRDTAASHHRAIVLEVMGRDAGWVALATGLAGGADATLVPEEAYDEAALLGRVRRALDARRYAVVVASEGVDLGLKAGSTGARDQFGHELLGERGVGAELARRIHAATGAETRSAQIGHIQRGGAPEIFDRILASRLGAGAVDLALAGRSGEVAVLRGESIVGIPFDEALTGTRTVDATWLSLLHTFDA